VEELRFIKATAITFASQIVALVFMMVSGIIIARVLGPSGKGAYTIVFLIPALLFTFGNLGIGAANTYFGGSKKFEWHKIASNSFILAIVFGGILIAGFILYYFAFYPSFLRGIEASWMLLALVTVPFSLLIEYFSMILLGQKRLRRYNSIILLQSGLGLVLLSLLILVLRRGILEAILASVVATIIGAIFSMLLLGRGIRIGLHFDSLLFRNSLVFGLKGHVGNVFQFLNYRLNFLLVAVFMSEVFVGYYSVSVALAEVLLYFPGAVGTVIFGRTSSLPPREANRSTPVICRQTVFITLMLGVPFFILGGFLVSFLYGPAFLPAVLPFWILLPGSVALTIPKILCSEMTGRGKPHISTYVALISFSFNLPLNVLLIPEAGIAGAALATTITYSVSAIITLIAFTRISNNSLRDTILIKRQDLKIYRNLLLGLRRKRPSA
jgi:O-antigen/teichoic acid export membrane protein